MVRLSSSAIRYVSYDPKTRFLRITFTSGGTYNYSKVPRWMYAELLAAPSAGTYFNDNIRDQYSLRRQKFRVNFYVQPNIKAGDAVSGLNFLR